MGLNDLNTFYFFLIHSILCHLFSDLENSSKIIILFLFLYWAHCQIVLDFFLFGPVVQEMLFKDFYLWWPFWAILVEGLMKDICVK